MSAVDDVAPDWDLEQLEVILEEPSEWQLVVAGPGAGKSAVACQRIAYLVEEGVSPSRMLLVSFTRTAVAELRDRIVNYAYGCDRARDVRIATIDSHVWGLRAGLDDQPISTVFSDDSYDLNIARAVELFRERQPELCDFMSRLEHLVIDEAQDVMGIRAELIIELLRSLSKRCGVTILADPAQAIYGFTNDSDDQSTDETSLLSCLESECPRELLFRELREIHRIKDGRLLDLFVRTRKEIELPNGPNGHIERIQKAIREESSKGLGLANYSGVANFLANAGEDSMLVLFRRRADVLYTSSYCSTAGIQHRLRMSGLPVVVRPWIGWVFGEYIEAFTTRERFSELWDSRGAVAPEPLAGEDRDACWRLLHRVSAGKRSGTIDLVQLRRLVSRSRPPAEICYPELGTAGPILGTIHASKGREEDTVVLVMPPPPDLCDDGVHGRNGAMVYEEGRVYYVGATRARKMLVAAGSRSARVSYLDSRRVFRRQKNNRGQLEVGREGDVDQIAHLAWSTCVDNQKELASCVGRITSVKARTFPEHDYATRIILEQTGGNGVMCNKEIGQMSESFAKDVWHLCNLVDPGKRLKPAPEIRHLYLVAVTTVGLSDSELGSVKPPISRSGLALAPVVKGFPTIQFLYRKRQTGGW